MIYPIARKRFYHNLREQPVTSGQLQEREQIPNKTERIRLDPIRMLSGRGSKAYAPRR